MAPRKKAAVTESHTAQIGMDAPDGQGTTMQPIVFEEGLAQLEQLVARMEDGALTLDESLSAYEQGMALHARLDAVLRQGERRIQILQMNEGEPDAQAEPLPFEVEA